MTLENLGLMLCIQTKESAVVNSSEHQRTQPQGSLLQIALSLAGTVSFYCYEHVLKSMQLPQYLYSNTKSLSIFKYIKHIFIHEVRKSKVFSYIFLPRIMSTQQMKSEKLLWKTKDERIIPFIVLQNYRQVYCLFNFFFLIFSLVINWLKSLGHMSRTGFCAIKNISAEAEPLLSVGLSAFGSYKWYSLLLHVLEEVTT